jgi:hypothetical protein
MLEIYEILAVMRQNVPAAWGSLIHFLWTRFGSNQSHKKRIITTFHPVERRAAIRPLDLLLLVSSLGAC